METPTVESPHQTPDFIPALPPRPVIPCPVTPELARTLWSAEETIRGQNRELHDLRGQLRVFNVMAGFLDLAHRHGPMCCGTDDGYDILKQLEEQRTRVEGVLGVPDAVDAMAREFLRGLAPKPGVDTAVPGSPEEDKAELLQALKDALPVVEDAWKDAGEKAEQNPAWTPVAAAFQRQADTMRRLTNLPRWTETKAKPEAPAPRTPEDDAPFFEAPKTEVPA